MAKNSALFRSALDRVTARMGRAFVDVEEFYPLRANDHAKWVSATKDVVRRIRSEFGISQSELAGEMGIGNSPISRWLSQNSSNRPSELHQRILMGLFDECQRTNLVALVLLEGIERSWATRMMWDFVSNGSVEDALNFWEEIRDSRKERSDNDKALLDNGKGLALWKIGELKEALSTFTDAQEFEVPDRIMAALRLNQAGVLSCLGRKEEALQVAADVVNNLVSDEPVCWLVYLCAASVNEDKEECLRARDRYLDLRSLDIKRAKASQELLDRMSGDEDFDFARSVFLGKSSRSKGERS